MKKIKIFLAVFLLSLLFLCSGCNFDPGSLLQSSSVQNEDKPFKAEIVFGENDKIVGYIKSLGIEDDGQVYIGGASLNYLYDKNGNIIGSYNYQKVLYIKILAENKEK
ncbi:MAG: hypothetical protein ABFD08_17355 [Syntrophomonas sp.]